MPNKSAATSRWIAFRLGLRVAVPVAIAASWSLLGPRINAVFPFIAGVVFMLHAVCYGLDRTYIETRWSATDTLRLAFWRTVSPTLTMLLVAVGFDAMYDRRFVGICWLIAAAVLAVIGAYRLRVAEGLKLQRVKSGDVYKRAFAMAKSMQIPLKRVYVVPAGKGHLTNAFALSKSIAVTDNYGKFLDNAELDFVIGHELGHVKGRHGRKKLLAVVVVFAAFAVICFFFPASLIRFRPLLDFFLLLMPMLTYYSFSRRDEYAADRSGVEFTHDAKAAIRALENLYDFTQAPTRRSTIADLFSTHPSLERRIAAISAFAEQQGEPRTSTRTS